MSQTRLVRLLSALLLALTFLSPALQPAQALSTGLVISQFQIAGATAADEFVELHNISSSPIDLNGHVLVYRSSTGTSDVSLVSWASSVVIPAGGYYLIAATPGYDGGVADSTYADGGSGKFSGSSGGIALRNGAVNTGAIVDSVGYGSATNAFVETATTTAPASNTSKARSSNGCLETDNNSTDFELVNPSTPRNSASAANICAASPSLAIGDVSLNEGNSGITTFTFDITLSAPAPVGGVTFDIATADGTATAGSDYVANSLTGVTIPEGSSSTTFSVDVTGDTSVETDETFNVNITSLTGATAGDTQGLGTILNDDGLTPTLSISDVTAVEGDSGTTLFTFTVSLDILAPSTVTFDIATADGTATAGSDYVTNSLTGQTINAGAQTATFDVTVNGDTTYEPDETFLVNVSNLTGATAGDAQGLGTITNDDPTPIYLIQGNGAASPLVGNTLIAQGVVVANYEYVGGAPVMLNGFYIQEVTGDSDPTTSDGIFVYTGITPEGVALGDLVRVSGTVSEYQGQTQISATPANISLVSSGNSITPTNISLPFASSAEAEQYEGMLVTFPQTLYVTEHYQLGRFGQVVLSGTDRLYQPTHLFGPGTSEMFAQQTANSLNQIILDDGNQSQNVDPIVFGRGGNPLSASNTLRGGDTIANLTGVFTYTWGGNAASPNAYRIRPINALGGGAPNFAAANPRPAAAPAASGRLRVVSMNLLNYFNTFDGLPDVVDNCAYGVGGAAADCRGADDAIEFDRQAAKIVNAIVGSNAAVVAFMEIENDGYGPTSAIQDLIDRLNTATAPGTYAFLDVDALTAKTNALGTDAIKVGILYQPALVTPIGTTAVLDSVAFVTGGDTVERNRVSLLQAFRQNENDEVFLVNANHLKSKGSPCDVPDQLDGQANCAIVRTNAVNQLLTWFATDPTGTGDSDILVLGDLNSYAKEDPITAFTTGGFTNLNAQFGGDAAYSYLFGAQFGYLDYALASASLQPRVTGVAEWHINADEPGVLDYNTNFKTTGQITDLYDPAAFRTSDHDPIVVDLNLDVTAPTLVSITRANPNPSGAASVDFTVTFSEAVSGVDATDFSVVMGGLSGASVTNVSGSGATYTVTVSTGSGSGTLRLDVAAASDITDLAGNALSGLPFTSGESYDIAKVYSFYFPIVFR